MKKSKLHDDGIKQCNQCKSNEEDYKKAVRETQMIKRDNDDLRVSLKDMSKALDEKLAEKAKSKQIGKPAISQDNRVEVLEQQVKNAKTQVENYKKTLEFFSKKSKGDYSVTKVNQLQISLKDKQDKYKDLKLEAKKLEAEKRATENKLLRDRPEKQLNVVREEIMSLRNKIRQQQKLKAQNDKNYEDQEKLIDQLQARQQEVCEKVGIDNKPVKRPTEDQLFRKNSDDGGYQSDDDDKDKKYKNIQMTYDKFTKMEAHIRILQQSMGQNQEKHEKKVKELEKEIEEIESQKTDIQSQLFQKKKHLEEDQATLKEIQSKMKRASYSEMGSMWKKEQQIRRVQAGTSVGSEHQRSFRDVQELLFPDDMYISEVSLTYVANFIIGMDVIYKNRKGPEKQRVSCFKTKANEIDGQVVKSLKLSQMEYISQVTGFYSFHIEYIKIITSRGQYIWAGSDKAHQHCNKFSVDIKKDERPSSFFGSVDFISNTTRRKQNSEIEQHLQNEYVMVAIGAELKKKESQQSKLDKQKIRMMKGQNGQQQQAEEYEQQEDDEDNNQQIEEIQEEEQLQNESQVSKQQNQEEQLQNNSNININNNNDQESEEQERQSQLQEQQDDSQNNNNNDADEDDNINNNTSNLNENENNITNQSELQNNNDDTAKIDEDDNDKEVVL